MLPKKRVHKWGTWKSGWVEQADRKPENQSTGPGVSPGSGLCWPHFPSHTGSGGWGKTGGGQSTNTGPAPNPHHPLSNLWHPKTEQGWGYAAEWGPSLLYWPKLNFHVASFKRLPAWQIKSSSVKGHFYVLETEVPTDSSFRSQTGPPSSLHPSHNAAVRAILLACKYAPVTWPFGIV